MKAAQGNSTAWPMADKQRWIVAWLAASYVALASQAVVGDDAEAFIERMTALGRERRLTEAVVAGREAAAILERRSGNAHADMAACHFELARLLAEMGDTRQAAGHADRSRRAVRGHISQVLSTLDEREQMRFLKTHDEERLHSVLSLGLHGRDDADVAALSAGWLANGKAVAQEAATEVMLTARESRSPEADRLLERLMVIRGQLAGIRQTVPGPGGEDAYRVSLQELEQADREILGELAAAAPRSRVDSWAAIDEIRRAVPASGVLIDIARFTPRAFPSPAAQGRDAGSGAPCYVAWIVPPARHGQVMVLDLGEAESIDEMIVAMRSSIETDAAAGGDIFKKGERETERQLLDAVTPLADRTIRPLFAAATKAIGTPPEEIVISPDGALWLLPWAALPLADGRYAVEAAAISHVSSGREIARSSTADAPVRMGDPLIIAAPDFDAVPAHDGEASVESPPGTGTQRRLSPVEPLPGAHREAYLIAPAIGRLVGTEPVMATGAEASEPLMKRVKHPALLVLSTHGFFMPDQSHAPSTASLLLGGRGGRARAESVAEPLEHPLTRCGLALAGCNAAGAAVGADVAGDDGILTGLEIVGCDLRGTSLVVLSACQTALGDVRIGEGVAGLRQAFRLAGARAVVATLWSVSDRDTVDLMTPLFGRLADGMEPARALRAAQREVIAKRRREFAAAHPFSWAAFTVTGR